MLSRAARLDAWLRDHPTRVVDLDSFQQLLSVLAPISESALRRLLRQSGANLHPLAAGVDQDSFPALLQSLAALANCYQAGGRDTARLARRIVITARDHAELAARNPRVAPDIRARKQEMAACMLIWLENPAVFPLWAALREQSRNFD